MVNPMDDWVEGKYPDRRMPPQSAVLGLMRELHADLDAARTERKLADERREKVMTRLDSLEKAVAALETKIEPVVEALRIGRAMRWLLGGLIAAIVSLAASYAWVKEHLITMGQR